MDWQHLMLRARQSLQMTQEEFADHLGVTQASVSRWENGSTAPSGSIQNSIREIVLGTMSGALIADEGLLRVINSSPNLISVANANFELIAVSWGVCELLAVPPDMLLNKPFQELHDQNVFADQEGSEALIQLRTGEAARMTSIVHFTENGTVAGKRAVHWGYTHGYFSAVPILMENLDIGIHVSLRLMTSREAEIRGGKKSWSTAPVPSLLDEPVL
ncbi:MAG: helix-turn-helix domain-containing protein [Hyphomicrobiales bacterium]